MQYEINRTARGNVLAIESEFFSEQDIAVPLEEFKRTTLFIATPHLTDLLNYTHYSRDCQEKK